MIPEHVLAEWRTRTDDNEAYQLRKHISGKHDQDFESCWFCTRQKYVCSHKKRFEALEDALVVADLLNRPDGPLLVPYICRWGTGLHFHNRTAKTRASKRRARKRLAKKYVDRCHSDA